ncbi:MAG: heavy metal-associated domain-containing protein [Bryobacterales bacterium]|nr:heavy metal-associated domain-containing protein [Bryobacterales bacterium]
MESKSRPILLEIDGMHCDGCVRRVRKLLEMAGAAEVDQVEIGSARISVRMDGPDAAVFVEALNEAGFVARSGS